MRGNDLVKALENLAHLSGHTLQLPTGELICDKTGKRIDLRTEREKLRYALADSDIEGLRKLLDIPA